MAGEKVRYDDDRSVLVVGEGPDIIEVRDNGADDFFAHLDDVRNASATDLRRALQRSGLDSLLFNVGDRGSFDYEYSLAESISMSVSEDELVVEVIVEVEDYLEESEAYALVAQILGPLLHRTRSRLMGAEVHPNAAAAPWPYVITLLPSRRGRTVGELFRIGRDAEDLVAAAATGSLTRLTALDLLRAGRADLLVGQPEGQWLDAKRQDYDLDDDRGKIALAQDVARFANGDGGGIVVVGMGTRKTRLGEVLSEVRPLPPLPHGVRRHTRAIDNRVFPPVDGLTVDEVAAEGGVVLVVHVPEQPEELKPFLVHGAVVGGRVEGAFISIVRRRGEESVPTSAQAIHSTLAAGRALLRRGELPAPGAAERRST